MLRTVGQALSPVAVVGVIFSVGLSAQTALPMGHGETVGGGRAVQGSCFLLYESGVGEVRRSPATTCSARVSPQSTFKIPHALAALDAGILRDANTVFKYDGRAVDFPAWRKDHSLASAMRDSVVWFFQDIATRLGDERERTYLDRFEYGNRDASGGLTTFWLGRSLAISPEEQVSFLRKLYGGQLNAAPAAVKIVRQILIQPAGTVTNARGEHPFARPWPAGTVVAAKTGSGPTGDGNAVRWLVGRVERGTRSWIFASNVVGNADTPQNAAIELAERALIAEHVLR
jgi:beta-lactamase class D